jgi:hypothetical protein
MNMLRVRGAVGGRDELPPEGAAAPAIVATATTTPRDHQLQVHDHLRIDWAGVIRDSCSSGSGRGDLAGDDRGVFAHPAEQRRPPLAKEVDADEVEAGDDGARPVSVQREAVVVEGVRPRQP